MKSCCSSDRLTEEIKCRIKDKYKSQENFGKALGASRKTVNRMINCGTDFKTLFLMCEMLGIKEISIV